jgi:hypothetical protein
MDISYYKPYSIFAPRMSILPIPFIVKNEPIALAKPHIVRITAVLQFP